MTTLPRTGRHRWPFPALACVFLALAAAGATPTSFDMAMMHQMAVMNRQMTRASMTGNPDHDFAAMMIPHHAGAIAMARLELNSGKDPVLRRLAEEIVVTQQQEILVMQRELRHITK